MILSLCVRCKYRIKFAVLKNVENMKLKELTLKELKTIDGGNGGDGKGSIRIGDIIIVRTN